MTVKQSYKLASSIQQSAPKFDPSTLLKNISLPLLRVLTPSHPSSESSYSPKIICSLEPDFGQWEHFKKLIKAAGIEHRTLDIHGATALCADVSSTVDERTSTSNATRSTSGPANGASHRPKPRASAANKDKQRDTEESAKRFFQPTIEQQQQRTTTRRQAAQSDLPVNGKKAAPVPSSSRTVQTRAAAANKTTAANDRACLRYPAEGSGAVTAFLSDVDKLAEGEFREYMLLFSFSRVPRALTLPLGASHSQRHDHRTGSQNAVRQDQRARCRLG